MFGIAIQVLEKSKRQKRFRGPNEIWVKQSECLRLPFSAGVFAMSDISPISRPNASSLNRASRTDRPSVPSRSPIRSSDSVELSSAARMLNKLREAPGIRTGLVADIRAQIANGTYETSDKINASLDNLIQDLV